MSIGGVVFQALRALVTNRCYPNTFDQPDGTPPVWPAIRYALISETPIADQCGTDDGETDDVRVQIDAVALTYGGSMTLRDSIVAALMATDPPCVRESEQQLYDDETKTHRVILEYVFNPSSAPES